MYNRRVLNRRVGNVRYSQLRQLLGLARPFYPPIVDSSPGPSRFPLGTGVASLALRNGPFHRSARFPRTLSRRQ